MGPFRKYCHKCAPPSVKLVGRGGKDGDELAITAEVPFHFALDGYSSYSPVIVKPDSDNQCWLGMNVIPSLAFGYSEQMVR